MTDRRGVRSRPPLVGSPTGVRFPAITRDELASGLRIWSLPWHPVPVVTVALVIEAGAAHDPADRPGLASLTADLVDEGAAGRNAVELSEAFARLGSHLEVAAGQDLISLSFTTLARNLDEALGLLADVVTRPHLDAADFFRIRELRMSRLRQLRTSAPAVADRAFLEGVFGSHPYGHGTLGTTRALEAASLDDVHTFYQRFSPAAATLVVAGDVPASAVAAQARARFRDWGQPRSLTPQPRGSAPGSDPVFAALPPPLTGSPRCLLVDRPGAPQAELRIGRLGPARHDPAYPALVTLNAALGGQFTSRINQHLRETKGHTYGARTGFDFRRLCSSFSCDTSVQPDAAPEAIADVLAEFAAAQSTRPIAGDELARAKNSLTRGYVRHFETPAHLVRAAVELRKFDLADDTFDRFVPAVEAVTEEDVLAAAGALLQPDACVLAVVGDAERYRTSLQRFRRPVVEMSPEF